MFQVRQVPTEPEAADKALIADVRSLLECIGPKERPEEGFFLGEEEHAENAHAVCIISSDLGFDRLLKECRSFGCATVVISDLLHMQYKHADAILGWELVQRGLV